MATGVKIVCLSNVTGAGVDQVRELLASGKTTLINRLLGDEALDTGAVSHTREGRHTTTRRHLMVQESGGLLIDMPGVRELGMLGAGEGIEETFSDIHALAQLCQYPECRHGSEPGCEVRAAIARRELSEAHLQNHLKLRQESEFHDLSHVDRRKKRPGIRPVCAHLQEASRWIGAAIRACAKEGASASPSNARFSQASLRCLLLRWLLAWHPSGKPLIRGDRERRARGIAGARLVRVKGAGRCRLKMRVQPLRHMHMHMHMHKPKLKQQRQTQPSTFPASQ